MKNNKQNQKRGSLQRAKNNNTSTLIGNTSKAIPNLVRMASQLSNILPARMNRVLTYAETFSFTTGAAGIIGTTQLMLLNSIFDPNSTGTGHQPYGRDQMALFYGFYQVMGCKVTLVATTPGVTSEILVAWKFQAPYGFVTIAGMSVDRVTETPVIGSAFVGPSGNDRSLRVSFNTIPWQILGITKQQYQDQNSVYGAPMTTNATQSPAIEIGIGSYSGAAAAGLTIQVIMDFDCEFSQPVQLVQS